MILIGLLVLTMQGIATQIIVERQLALKGINSKELTREDFIKEIWDWKNESGNTILNQMQRIGVAAIGILLMKTKPVKAILRWTLL